MKSVEQRLAEAGNRPSGFDYLRLILASGVIAQHTVNVSYGQPAALDMLQSMARLAFGPILPMFFALSGFLVAGSLERNRSLISFLGLRVLRLFPALLCEVTLSALLLGPVFTNLKLEEYFSDSQFRNYFWNLSGDIHYLLPGVFANNPLPRIVNGQLWTLPSELSCYCILAAFSFIGIIWRRNIFIFVVFIIQVAFFSGTYSYFPVHPPLSPPPVLIGCFLVGVCAHGLRHSIPVSLPLAVGIGVIAEILLLLPYGDWFMPVPITYLTIYIGTLNPRRQRLLSGDYSYGLYLYGFPIQQAIATQNWTHHSWINLTLAYPITFLFAVVSWRCVERPAMKLKALVYLVENKCLQSRLFRHRDQDFLTIATPAARLASSRAS
jgi:peptidoglycan/LPS O-acetylase OafA/YrhL